jgi:ribosomal protein S6
LAARRPPLGLGVLAGQHAPLPPLPLSLPCPPTLTPNKTPAAAPFAPAPQQNPSQPTTTNPPLPTHSDKELAKFEAFLNKEECLEIGAIVRPRARLAYPMDRHKSWEGVYVLYTYAAKRQTAKAVQLLLSNPEAGSEDKLMRHITFCKY